MSRFWSWFKDDFGQIDIGLTEQQAWTIWIWNLTNSRNKTRLCWRKPSSKRTFCLSSHWNKSQDKSVTIYVCPVLLMKSNQIEQRTSRFDGDMFFPPLLLMEELWNSCSWALPHPKWGGRGQLYLKTQSWFQKSLKIVHCLLASTTKIRLLNNRAR